MKTERKLKSGEHALEFWYLMGKVVTDYGMPSLYVLDDEAVKSGVNQWDYPDWFYMWLDVDRVINKLQDQDKRLIIDYFDNVYPGPTDRWKHKDKWGAVRYRVFYSLSDEHKEKK